MAKRKKGSFAGKMAADVRRRRATGSETYLNLPAGVKMFEPEPDEKYTLDFIPYDVTDKKHPDRIESLEIAVEGYMWWKRPYKRHTSVGVENEKIVCPRSVGKPCPICELNDELRKNYDENEDEIRTTNASERVLYNVIPIGAKKFDEEIHIMDFSDYLMQQPFEKQLKDDPKWATFAEPDGGHSIKIAFDKGSFGGNTYPEPTRFDFVKRDNQYDLDIVDDAVNLDEIMEILDYEVIKKKFFEAAPVHEEEDDDEETNSETSKLAGRKHKKSSDSGKEGSKKKKKNKDDKPEPEPEPETKSGKKGKKKSKSKPEPEPEPEPAKRKRKKSQPEPEPEPVKKKKKKPEPEPEPKKKKVKSGDDECPHGHKFGVDTDEYNECDKCEVWDKCYRAKKKK